MATLARWLGDLDLAEEVAAEAVAAAVERWPVDGVPQRPTGFTEGYAASAGPDLTRPGLADEAVRLARVLHRLLPEEREAMGLLALLLLVDARRDARSDQAGDVVLLADQDRSLWDQAKIREGVDLVERALPGGDPGPYALQAAIAAVHAEAGSAEETDWLQIVALYDVLARVEPSPLVALNRAVAVGMARGAAAGLAILDELLGDGALNRYHLLHSARGRFLERLDRFGEAAQAYRRALDSVGNEPERALLQHRLAAAEEAARRLVE